MGSKHDPAQALALRLRALRKDCWPGTTITQAQLAAALGGDRPLSVPLVSSWESPHRPTIPPIPRIEAYATFFATARSLEGGTPHLLDPATEMTAEELQVKDDLLGELMRLRSRAMAASSAPARSKAGGRAGDPDLWSFDDGSPITLVCAELPDALLARMPYTDPVDPDFIALYRFADLDALFELHGHVRASNPGSQVNLRTAQHLTSDDYTTHLVLLGGVDWNVATRWMIRRLNLPVEQVADWETQDGVYYEIREGDRSRRYLPRLEQVHGRQVLREDVALFARAVNPYNRERTVSVCNGMYGSGTFGAVRATTDANFRDRNTGYVRKQFEGREAFLVIMRVIVENSVPLTPDWTIEENRLFEWLHPQR